MTYWVLDGYADRGEGMGRAPVYKTVDTLPGRKGDAFYAVTPYNVRGKPFGLKDDRKPVLLTVYGVGREDLLVKYAEPDKVSLYDRFESADWTTVRFDQTTEGWRFVRSVVKLMKVLTAIARKAAVERNKVERNRAAAKAREGREGTCQICEGRQIIQPTGKNKATLVLHGYKRPGNGYTIGNCYGYHRKPFEVACDALTEWVDILAREKSDIESGLAKLSTLTVLVIKVYKGFGKEELVTIGPDDKRWSTALESKKWELESNLRSVTRELEYQSKRLADWRPA